MTAAQSTDSAITDEAGATTATVLGGSGFTGGELLRLVWGHPNLRLIGASSRQWAGRSVGAVHPNLRGLELRFVEPNDLPNADIIFAAVPHGVTGGMIDALLDDAELVVDLSADFRLDDAATYAQWYDQAHPNPAVLDAATYGLPEVNRDALEGASIIAVGGCNATATIIGLHPLAHAGILDAADPIVVDIKVGSSEGGSHGGPAASHPERSGVVRPYAPIEHRHEAEIERWLGTSVSFTAHAVDMVRGASATCHVFPAEPIETVDLWSAYRSAYEAEPFVRLQAGGRGLYRYPEPKAVAGTNMAEVGFVSDDERIVVFSAIDNMMKGSAGQAIHAANIALGYDETAGLTFPGLHPVGSP